MEIKDNPALSDAELESVNGGEEEPQINIDAKLNPKQEPVPQPVPDIAVKLHQEPEINILVKL